ncbi:hypothetical protein EIP91_010067 [Steccherinum ochraceum]|uniref:F-box domain-containing protein n=1 Tax=Steccherinum ochraceum TaxID=92696 RepID=A0A4R0R360_9APHY|nr:hypothetical protein EIP91_010067 [Steccherinum ochraceum]
MPTSFLPTELWDQIISSLSDAKPVLLDFSLASHACRDIALPHLFKKTTVRGGPMTPFAAFISFLRNQHVIAGYIRHLTLDWDAYSTFKNDLPPRLDSNSLRQILSCLPALKSLCIRDIKLVTTLPLDSPLTLTAFSLDTLSIEGSGGDQLLTNCPILGVYQILSLFFCVKNLKLIHLSHMECSCLTEPSWKLRLMSGQVRLSVSTLYASQSWDIYPVSFLLHVLRRTPSRNTLTSIIAQCVMPREASQYGELIAACGPRIVFIDLTIKEFYHDVKDPEGLGAADYDIGERLSLASCISLTSLKITLVSEEALPWQMNPYPLRMLLGILSPAHLLALEDLTVRLKIAVHQDKAIASSWFSSPAIASDCNALRVLLRRCTALRKWTFLYAANVSEGGPEEEATMNIIQECIRVEFKEWEDRGVLTVARA